MEKNRWLLIPVISLLLAATAVSAATGTPGELASPPDGGWTSWSEDATGVLSANRALQFYEKLSDKTKRRLAWPAWLIAKYRRAALARLIRDEPRQALWLSLAPGQRQGLPKFILDQLETRVHAVDDLDLAITEDMPGAYDNGQQDTIDLKEAPPVGDSIASWSVDIDGTTRQAFAYGIRQKHQTKFDTPIHGILLDDAIAISEQQLYRYDAFEAVQLGFKPDQIVATGGDFPIQLPDIGSFVDLEQVLRGQLLRFGPLPIPANPNEWTTGIKTVLVIKVQYAGDSRETPYSDADIAAWMAGANTFFRENSQGATSFIPTIVSGPLPVLAADNYRASSEEIGHGILADSAIQTARAYGYDPDSYDRIVILAPQLFDAPKSTARIGGKAVVVTTDTAGDLRTTLAHELGHTYGFSHSSYLRPVDPSNPIGSGTFFEYGDAWDMMGAAGVDDTGSDPTRRHFNAFFKWLAGWLPVSGVADATTGGTFRLRAHDSASAAGVRALFIDAGDGTFYWFGRRSQFPWNEQIANGVEVRRVREYSDSGYSDEELLRMPRTGVPNVSEYHSLLNPNSFQDVANGITVRVAPAVQTDGLGEYLEVYVTRL